MADEHCTCFKCAKLLPNLRDPETGLQPNCGLAFATGGHYGSTYFDMPMLSQGDTLQIAICDECVKQGEADGLVFRGQHIVRTEVRRVKMPT